MATKNGIVRRGDVNPYRKSTEAEVEERVTEVEKMLRAGPILKSQLVKFIKNKFEVQRRMAEYYIARARERMLLRLNRVKDEHRAESLSYYEGVILNPAATVREKVVARERIDKLLGLEVAQRLELEHSGTLHRGVDVDALELDLPTRKKLLSAVRTNKPVTS